MRNQRRRPFIFSILALLFILFGFQNCNRVRFSQLDTSSVGAASGFMKMAVNGAPSATLQLNQTYNLKVSGSQEMQSAGLDLSQAKLFKIAGSCAAMDMQPWNMNAPAKSVEVAAVSPLLNEGLPFSGSSAVGVDVGIDNSPIPPSIDLDVHFDSSLNHLPQDIYHRSQSSASSRSGQGKLDAAAAEVLLLDSSFVYDAALAARMDGCRWLGCSRSGDGQHEACVELQTVSAPVASTTTSTSTTTTLPVVPGPSVFKTTLVPKQNSVPTDIIMIFDNSGSMRAEAAQVKANIVSFIQKTESLVDMKFALITAPETGTAKDDLNLTLPVVGPNYMQVEQRVVSHNGLVILTQNLAAGMPLKNFLRPKVRKMIVVVSDDDSLDMTSAVFRSDMSALLPATEYVMFGWIGKGAVASPCQARDGLVYDQLASLTGGKTYNICDVDWSSHFADLTSQISNISITGLVDIPSASSIKSVLSVKLNGRVLTSTEFQRVSSGIQINKALLTGSSSYDVEISFDRM